MPSKPSSPRNRLGNWRVVSPPLPLQPSIPQTQLSLSSSSSGVREVIFAVADDAGAAEEGAGAPPPLPGGAGEEEDGGAALLRLGGTAGRL